MPCMPSKAVDPHQPLYDIRENIELAYQFVGSLDFEAFCENRLVCYGVTRCLEIISEASRRLPDEIKARHPDIPWKEMAGAGNVYRHDYEDVQLHLIWGTVQNRFPALLAAVNAELSSED